MKLLQGHFIFTSRNYRISGFAGMLAMIAAAIIVPMLDIPLVTFFSMAIMFITMSLLVIFGDRDVFGGMYSKESCKIGALQSSLFGEKTFLSGIIADRIYILLQILICAYSIYVICPDDLTKAQMITPQSVFITALIVFVLFTAIVNINRYIYLIWVEQLVAVFELGILMTVCAFFGLVFPLNGILPLAITIVLAVVAVVLTVIHSKNRFRRGYYD